MRRFHRKPIAGLAVLVAALAGGVAAAQPPPSISRPVPAPATIPAHVAPLPPAQFDPTLVIGGPEVEAKQIETRLAVDVTVNGRGPFRFIVDSGADSSTIGLRVARDLQLPLAAPAILESMTSRDIVDRVTIDELGLGPTTIRNLVVPALLESDIGGDGIIGIDALVEKRLMLDFEKKLIKVEDARIPEARSPGEIVVVGQRRRGQLILTHVTAAGLPLDAVIDTGTEITIGNMALYERLLHGNRDKFLAVPVVGVTGVGATLQVARIRELKLGPVVLRNVPIAFADVPPFKLFGLSNQPALLLGSDLLESFARVSLDFRSRRVRFQLRRCTTQSIVVVTDPATVARLSSTGDEGVCER